MSDLAGKRALVTGASRGIGAGIALALARKGADVAITYERSADRAAEVVRAIEAQGRRGFAIQADSADPAAVKRSVEEAVRQLDGLDILVNNAGIARYGDVADISLEDIDAQLNVNVRGVWLMTRACRAALKDSGRGAIVNLASDTAMWGAPNLMAYVASKGAVMAMTRSMARELGADAITINAVAPGLVLVEATEYVPEHRHRLYIDQRALQREQGPEDVSGAVSYLLSDGARFVTGQVLPVNGGFVMN